MTTTLQSPAELTAAAEEAFDPVPLSAEAAADLRARLAASKSGRVLYPVNPCHVDTRRNIRNRPKGEDDTGEPPVKIDAGYVASLLRELRQVPSAYLLPDNTFRIGDGQRRTLAARVAPIEELDYVIKLIPEGSEAEQRAAEIVDQRTANTDRLDLTDEEDYRAIGTPLRSVLSIFSRQASSRHRTSSRAQPTPHPAGTKTTAHRAARSALRPQPRKALPPMTNQPRRLFKFGRRDRHDRYPVYTGGRLAGHVYHYEDSWWATEIDDRAITHGHRTRADAARTLTAGTDSEPGHPTTTANTL